MTRAGWVRFPALLVIALGAAACGDKAGRSLLQVDVTAASDLTGISKVEITVTQGTNNEVGSKSFAWDAPAGQPMKVGVYLSDSVDGTVTVRGVARDGGGAAIGSSTQQSAVVHAGQASAVVALVLNKTGAATDGGTDAGIDGSTDASTDATEDGPSDAPVDGGGSTDTPADLASPDGPVETPPDLPVEMPPVVLSWSPAVNTENDVVKMSRWPHIAIDPTQGTVLVGWTEDTAAAVRRYDATTRTWGPIKLLQEGGEIYDMTVAMSGGGRALAAWHQNDNNTTPELRGMWAAHSEDDGVNWSAPARIHNGPAWGDVALAVARDGNARVTWDETDGTIRSLWSASYQASTKTWTTAAVVKAGTDPYERTARMAMDNRGGGILVWRQPDQNGNDSVWGTTFTSTTDTLVPQLLEAHTTGTVYEPVVAINPDGSRGVVVWDLIGELWVNEFVTGTGWKGPQRVLTGDVGAPAVVMDRNSTITLAFTQPLAGGYWNVMSSRYVQGGTWSTPVPLETTNQAPGQTDQYPYASLGVDLAGNVHALWRRKITATGQTFGVFVRRYAAGMGWQPEQMLGVRTGLAAITTNLAVADDGRAAATFYYGDPTWSGDQEAFNIYVGFFR